MSAPESSVDGPDPWPSFRRLLALALLSAVVFGIGVYVAEIPAEIGLDVDFKPFVIPYLLIAVLSFGRSTLAVGFGAAMGEGYLDVAEGYELDDPLGFVGYVVGFLAFGYLLHRVAPRPDDRRWQMLAALGGAFVQAAFEGVAFILLAEADVGTVAASILGNTVTHGLLFGAIPLVVLYPVVRDRVAERLPSVAA
ncbi:hypothetical protein VB773_13395 [Haloarculaceae archaeon H-GB2-1]|nr:hypothetical protein [Haloarculaceae archaeon H-GB1-1]MEA5408465.1 hypothetical protein [Haloarculaceae archaeon H-GB2-1]